MGNFDRRNSMKMKRRRAQAKKKERIAKVRAVTKKATPTPAKRASKPKKESAPAAKA